MDTGPQTEVRRATGFTILDGIQQLPASSTRSIEDEGKRPERQHNDIRFFDHRWRYRINGGRDEIQVRRIAHVTSGYGSPARVAGLDPA